MKKKNMIARLRASLQSIAVASIGLSISANATAQASLPSMDCSTSQQVHFLLEEPSITRATLREIGQFWGQSDRAMVLAIVEGTPSSGLPWPGTMPAELGADSSAICILRASRSWWPNSGAHIHFQKVVVPSSTFPAAWADLGGVSSVLLTVNGVEHTLEPDVPMALPPLADGVTLTSLGLEIVLGNGASRSAGIVLPTRSTCPQPMPDLPPWSVESTENPWWVGTFHEGIAVTGSALVRLGADGVFDSPVILCDGFDPDLHQHAVAFGHGDQNWETLWDCSRTYKVTLDSLHAIGKDVVFLDFADGTLDVLANAALLQHVISLCNEHKTTPAPLAVIGVSMGGVIARMALRGMETNGTPHCTGLFVAFDSPMRGAYLPWSMLQAIDFFAGISAEAEDLHHALASTAAQQLLFLTPSGVPSAHAGLQVEMMAQGLPVQPRCASIVNSHPESNFPLDAGPLLQASESLFGWEYAHVQLNALPGDADHDASTSTLHVTFDADIPNASWWFGEPFVFSQTSFCSSSAPQVGKWPGSRTAHLEAFESALEAGGIGVTASQSETMFIPSKSALDVPFSGQASDTPFDWVHTESFSTGSTSHCDLTNHHEALMVWIDAATSIDHILYGHNWPNRQLIATSEPHMPSLTIGAVGSALMGSSSLPFETELSPCTSHLTIDSLLCIGDANGQHPGVLRIHEGQSLVIGPAGNLEVGPGSSLLIEAGGELKVMSGAHVNIKGFLHLQPNGWLLLDDLTQAAWTGAGATFMCEGHCELMSGAVAEWTIADGGQVLCSDATIHLPEGSSLQCSGDLGDLPNFQFEPNTSNIFTGSGNAKFFENHLLLQEGSELQFDGVFARMAHCEVHGTSAGAPLAVSQISSNHRMRISQTEMSHLFLVGVFEGQQALTILSSTFESCRISGSQGGANIASSEWEKSHFAWLHSDRPVILQDNVFTDGMDDSQPLVSLAHIPDGTLRKNSISHHREGLRLSETNALLGCNEFRRLETAVILLQGGFAVMNGESGGGNRFAENDVHIRCHSAPLPQVDQGENAFDHAFQERFDGSAWAQPGPGGSPAPLHAGGNAWPNPTGEPISPMMNSGLTACNPGLENQAIGISTNVPVDEANCDSSPHNPPPSQGAIKVNMECPQGAWSPNPAEQDIRFICNDKSLTIVQASAFDALGGLKSELWIDKNQSSLSHLQSGIYNVLTQAKWNTKTCTFHQRMVVLHSH